MQGFCIVINKNGTVTQQIGVELSAAMASVQAGIRIRVPLVPFWQVYADHT